VIKKKDHMKIRGKKIKTKCKNLFLKKCTNTFLKKRFLLSITYLKIKKIYRLFQKKETKKREGGKNRELL